MLLTPIHPNPLFSSKSNNSSFSSRMVIIEHADCTTVTNVSQEHCFFSTLKLLGFNVFAAEKQYKMPFKPDMFRVPCKKGLEVGPVVTSFRGCCFSCHD